MHYVSCNHYPFWLNYGTTWHPWHGPGHHHRRYHFSCLPPCSPFILCQGKPSTRCWSSPSLPLFCSNTSLIVLFGAMIQLIPPLRTPRGSALACPMEFFHLPIYWASQPSTTFLVAPLLVQLRVLSSTHRCFDTWPYMAWYPWIVAPSKRPCVRANALALSLTVWLGSLRLVATWTKGARKRRLL